MQILIAPNAFKHSLSGKEVASAIMEGFSQSRLECSCECFPVGDGGDGTGDLIVTRWGGSYVDAVVKDPLGREINSSYGLIDEGKTAVIEMASASGLWLLNHEELNPLHATSFGTGQQIKMAFDKGVNKVIIAMGGSATIDGACGMLQALGARFLDAGKNELNNLPAGLLRLTCIDLSGFDKRVRDVEIVVLCDVDNKLLGKQGSAAVFGPQKGASPGNIMVLDAALENYSNVILKQTGIDITSLTHGGTAGGAAAGLYAFLNATLVTGIDYFLEITEFQQSLQKADLVVTGEGGIDAQTLQGKAPFGVARRAKEKGLPVVALAGRVPVIVSDALQEYFDVILPIGNEPSDLTTALEHTTENIIRTSRAVGDLLNIQCLENVR